MVLNVKVKKNGQSHFEPGPLQQMPILVLDAFWPLAFWSSVFNTNQIKTIARGETCSLLYNNNMCYKKVSGVNPKVSIKCIDSM